MMLSKVAERIYWTARYIERVENTARLLRVYANLLLDLPSNVNLGWFNLVVLNSLEEPFDERYKKRDERNVVKFLLADDTNPNSMVNSLNMVRENVRTTRDVVPLETWELVNELSIFLNENVQNVVNRSQRNDCLDGIIRGCQQINGLLYGTMTHDEAWDFLRLGRNLERADMTTRILDAGVSAILHTEGDQAALNAQQIIWGTVLRSVGGEQPYRRKLRASVKGEEVTRYLLEDPQFPRTIQHCLAAMADSCGKLPRCKPIAKHLATLRGRVFDEVPYEELGAPMQEYLNGLQLELAALHGVIADNWFH